MPHQCTDCGRVFDDGSKQMLSGCPDCDGTTFQFHPGEDARARSSGAAESTGSSSASTSGPSTPGPGGVAETVSKTAATVRDIVGRTTGRSSDASTADTGSKAGRSPDGDQSTAGTGPADTPAATAEDEPTIDVDDVVTRSGSSDGADGDVSANADGATASTDAVGSDTDAATAESAASDDGEPATASGGPSTGASTAGEPSGRDPWSPGQSADGGGSTGTEDSAQASARTDLASLDELPPASDVDDEHRFDPVDGPDDGSSAESSAKAAEGEEDSSPTGDRPDLAELREKLNDQFESIKVVSPGQYELNLMELYDREEYIIALQEDGRYTVQVPENFHD